VDANTGLLADHRCVNGLSTVSGQVSLEALELPYLPQPGTWSGTRTGLPSEGNPAMNEFLCFLFVGLGFLILLLVWLLRSAGSSIDGAVVSEARAALTTIHVELPPRALVERIFDPQDWQFVSMLTPPQVQGIFLRERKALALSWLRQTRKQTGMLMAFHRKAVRTNVDLSPAFELRLAYGYFLFLASYGVLCGLIWLWGPFCARGIVGYVVNISEQLSFLSGRALIGMDPLRINKIRSS